MHSHSLVQNRVANHGFQWELKQNPANGVPGWQFNRIFLAQKAAQLFAQSVIYKGCMHELHILEILGRFLGLFTTVVSV